MSSKCGRFGSGRSRFGHSDFIALPGAQFDLVIIPRPVHPSALSKARERKGLRKTLR
jgi:hypothetical protein